MDVPFRVAVVGSGPAGMYATEHLLEQRQFPVEIDLIERLPTPWGLARSGVAPDHPEKKLVIDRHFAHLLRDSRVRFIGNVEVGADVGHAELMAWYDSVVYAFGSSGDVQLGIPGEDLEGCFSAREFVGFYNGHPDQRDSPVDLTCKRAVVIGNGNVALDLARILTLPTSQLGRTDISDVALETLRRSNIEEVVVMGRRGHRQAAFKNPELEELGHLPGVDIRVDTRGLPHDDEIAHETDPSLRRKLRTLRRLAERTPGKQQRRIVLRFGESPTRIAGAHRTEGVEVVRSRFESDSQGRLQSSPTAKRHVIETGLVLRAVGYRGTAMPGLPFDPVRGVVTNIVGRVVSPAGYPIPGVYVTGWAKRGSRGIMGSNKKCSAETIAHLLADMAHDGCEPTATPADVVLHRIQGRTDVVLREGWLNIDRAERLKGRTESRPRVKITDRPGLLAAAAVIQGEIT